MSRQTNKKFSNISAFDSRSNNSTRIKEQAIRNRCVLRTVEEVIQKMNKNDDKVLSKTFPTFPQKNQSGHPDFKHPQLDKCKDNDQKLSVTNSKYQTDEIQKPIFQNPAVEKYLNESMKKTLKRYKN